MMILNKIKLCNIGSYVGLNEFDFSVSKDRNIILIGGNNGAGKTTLLKSIKIGLYGSYSIGLKTISNQYIDMLKELFNKSALKDSQSTFYIEISYFEVENYSENLITIRREWYVQNSFSENIEFSINNEKRNLAEFDDYFSKMKQRTSIELLNSMIFDGEKIAQVIENGQMPSYVKNLIYSSFNFSIFSTINSDINLYLKRERENSTLSNEEINYFDQKNQFEITQKEKKNIEKRLDERIKALNDSTLKRKDLSEKYREFGGLDEDEYNKFVQDIQLNESIINSKSKEIKSFLNNDYAFALNLNLLKEARKKIVKEIPAQAITMIDLVKENNKYKITNSQYNHIMEILNDIRNGESIHDVDTDIYNSIRIKVNRLNRMKRNGFIESLDKNKELQGYLNVVKDQMRDNEEVEIKGISRRIASINESISEFNEDINEITNNLNKINKNYESELQKLYIFEDKLKKSKKTKSSFLMANKIVDLNISYIKRKTDNVLRNIEVLLIKYFNETISKERFFKSIKIDRDSFDIELITDNEDLLDLNNLSAGEKQILMGCLVKAVYNLSERRIPIIIDTPLARLDSKNRKGFVNKIFKDISRQVIVLSTDEEIINDVKESIDSNISKTYTLVNKGTKSTDVYENQYFGSVN
jgi:DNA sulfur modification protein DndD